MTSRTKRTCLEPIDYDLHGVVGIRLIDASSGDARAVARQWGLTSRPLSREPDIVIRFVDDLGSTSPLRYLGLEESAFTEDALPVLQDGPGARAKITSKTSEGAAKSPASRACRRFRS